ncbi:hypothetical protein QO239_08940 [Cupriavidus taiwanensis]|uniref:hypothetical protein n=1 Tax=Cupriavidus taiwanensis TaxID=164546 RepID=UPI002541B5D8|nr:hypothetical protein [Cupriavidus taiwanensis]MDK3022718.1 hypothetical protein [Cupriavidus taiwanensis]
MSDSCFNAYLPRALDVACHRSVSPQATCRNKPRAQHNLYMAPEPVDARLAAQVQWPRLPLAADVDVFHRSVIRSRHNVPVLNGDSPLSTIQVSAMNEGPAYPAMSGKLCASDLAAVLIIGIAFCYTFSAGNAAGPTKFVKNQ